MKSPFILTTKSPKPFVPYEFSVLRLPLRDLTVCKGLKKRSPVIKGMTVAEHSSPNTGDLHAPITGVITDITDKYIEITQQDLPEDSGLTPVLPVSFDGLSTQDLVKTLKQLGITTRQFTHPCNTLIINTLNPEPGIKFADEMLRNHRATLDAGIALLKRLTPAETIIAAVADGYDIHFDGMRTHHVNPVYPNCLRRPLAKIVTGKESSADITIIKIHKLFALGMVAQSGLPQTETVATVQGMNVLIPIGAPMFEVLNSLLIYPADGDSIILGGMMRGNAIANRHHGMDKLDIGLIYLKKGPRPALLDNPCINCGACVMACPMRLRPNMLSRYVQFELYKECHKEYIEHCIECGLCGYVCPACRPMQQHFRLAKHYLGLSTMQHIPR